MFSTFHARYPMLRWPLDHVFHEKTFTLVRLQRLRNIGSDHFPVCVELEYEPTAEGKQEAPKQDAEDPEEARERIAEGRVAVRGFSPSDNPGQTSVLARDQTTSEWRSDRRIRRASSAVAEADRGKGSSRKVDFGDPYRPVSALLLRFSSLSMSH